eukprot:GHRR01014098.1.p1 GENE.GHRR01014098.1~~GHRR01014098.1.p1  ORF type:complete len:200 (+),score=33.64 GHRR01014098.1:97-696(+)
MQQPAYHAAVLLTPLHKCLHDIKVASQSTFSVSASTSTMSSWWQRILDWLRSLFFQKEMELSLIGLQNAGKSSLVNVLTTGSFHEDMIPTVGFNMRKVTKGGVTIKMWDLGGQPRFRSLWERYCRGVQAIVYVVDAADPDAIEVRFNCSHNKKAAIIILHLASRQYNCSCPSFDEWCSRILYLYLHVVDDCHYPALICH